MSDKLALGQSRRAAITFVTHGWPVLPGTYSSGGRWRGSASRAGLQPVRENLAAAWTLDPAQAAEWWQDEPYSVLLACGYGVDCVEVPASVGPRALEALSRAAVFPSAMFSPVNTLVMFVRTPPRPRPLLVSASFRSAGWWVALPPTGQGGSDRGYRWVPGCSPVELDWQLPELGEVYPVISAAVSGMGARRRERSAT